MHGMASLSVYQVWEECFLTFCIVIMGWPRTLLTLYANCHSWYQWNRPLSRMGNACLESHISLAQVSPSMTTGGQAITISDFSQPKCYIKWHRTWLSWLSILTVQHFECCNFSLCNLLLCKIYKIVPKFSSWGWNELAFEHFIWAATYATWMGLNIMQLCSSPQAVTLLWWHHQLCCCWLLEFSSHGQRVTQALQLLTQIFVSIFQLTIVCHQNEAIILLYYLQSCHQSRKCCDMCHNASHKYHIQECKQKSKIKEYPLPE